MKIVYLCADRGIPVLGDKGASVHVRELISAFHRLEHEVVLLCSRLGSGNPHPPGTLIELAPPADSSELAKIAYDRKLADRAVEALASAGVAPDALYERFSLFARAGGEIAQRLGIPYVLEVNAPLVEEQERYRGLELKEIATAMERVALRQADAIVAVSDAVKQHLASRGVPLDRIVVLPNGVDTSRFHAGLDGESIRKRYELTGRPVIGFVGSIKPWHGLDFLLDALPRMLARLPDLALLVVGDGPGLAALRARIAQTRFAQSITLAGRVPHDEIPAHFAAMDASVAPYGAEDDGFYFSPLKVVESLACGCPVVAPRLGQLTRLVQDGVTGRLFAAGDAAEFADAVVELFSDRARLSAIGRAASAVAHSEFGWEHNARRVVALMEARVGA
jgi:glycosyltransferase involved in cell wall biosynthesis